MAEDKTFMVENAFIRFRNFSGKEARFNPAGVRTFTIDLDPVIANQMIADGWNVRYLEAREEGEEDIPIIQITVRFDIRPPRIVLITANTRTQLDENSLEILDWADIENADLIARGFYWNVNGKSGTKAYLQSLFVTIREDALERKYSINENPPSKSN
jgi:hypothetical protein